MLLLALAALVPASLPAQSAPMAPHGSEIGTLSPDVAPSPARHAGVYHVSTGTWTRSTGTSAPFGPDVVYSNTAWSGYYYNCEAPGANARALHFDEGALPGTTNGDVFSGMPDRDSYIVNGFSIGYCDSAAPGTSAWDIDFYGNYVPCTNDPSPDQTVSVSGLPAGGGCWTVDIDLSNGQEFCMQADGDSVWDDDDTLDSFGWSFRYTGAATPAAGFLLTGNPGIACPAGQPNCAVDTYFQTGSCPGESTGYLTQDFWFIEDVAGITAGCYWFGGYSNAAGTCSGRFNPMASFHMELVADVGECSSCLCQPSYCLSNPTSTGANVALELFGSDVATIDELRLRATGVPANSFGYFITSTDAGFVATPPGSEGNLCLSGAIGRFVAPGQIKNSGPVGLIELDTLMGEWSLQAIPSPTGPYAAAAGVTSHFQLWFRDTILGVPTSNFSDGAAVTWR